VPCIADDVILQGEAGGRRSHRRPESFHGRGCVFEYEILKNGLVIRRAKDGDGQYERVVEIFAEMRDAHLRLALANKICPVAAPTITKAMSLRATCSVNLPFKPSTV
jgi:hypothetical protein